MYILMYINDNAEVEQFGYDRLKQAKDKAKHLKRLGHHMVECEKVPTNGEHFCFFLNIYKICYTNSEGKRLVETFPVWSFEKNNHRLNSKIKELQKKKCKDIFCYMQPSELLKQRDKRLAKFVYLKKKFTEPAKPLPFPGHGKIFGF